MSDEINSNQPGMQGRRDTSVPPRMGAGTPGAQQYHGTYDMGAGNGNERYHQPGYGGYPYNQGQGNYGYGPMGAPRVERAQSNSMGTAGFVLSLVSMFLGWLPYCGWAIWLLAVVFSAIGLSRRPRGLAVAGLVISLAIPLLLVVAVVAFGFSLALLESGGF